jgi:hypothetical protein
MEDEMERSTAIAAVASGALVLVAGIGAVSAVNSLQQANAESVAVGQAQPQTAVATDVPASDLLTSDPTAPGDQLRKPEIAGSAAQNLASQGSAAANVPEASNTAPKSRPKTSPSSSGDSGSWGKSTGPSPSWNDDDDQDDRHDYDDDDDDDHGNDHDDKDHDDD